MKINLYLLPEGLEAHALGRNVYSWNWGLRFEDEEPPKNSRLVGTCEVTLPAKEACIAPVLANLKTREDEINLSAQADLMAIKQRKNDLLMLTHEGDA